MNRKKKLNQIFNKRLKKAKAKLSTNPQKEAYVSKAQRLIDDASEQVVTDESVTDKEQ